MENQEYLKQSISSFLDRFSPETDTDFATLQTIQNNLAAGQSLESQYRNFIAIADADLLRAFYQAAPDLKNQVLSSPRCPGDLAVSPPASSSRKPRHPLLSLDQEIDLDLKGLSDYEAALPAGAISGPEKAGCASRIQNLQRLFDRVPSVLNETDLSNNEDPLFYDLLVAKQRLSSNLRIFTRLRIGLSNRFDKSDLNKDEEAPERSLLEETPGENEPEPDESEPEPEGPTDEELEAEELAALEAEEQAKAEAEAAAEKKAADQKRQQRLRKAAKEQEERTLQEQRRQEESTRESERYREQQRSQSSGDPGSYQAAADAGSVVPPVVPPYEYTSQSPASPDVQPTVFDDQAEVLRRQEETRKDQFIQESDRQREQARTAQDENLQHYQSRMDESRRYESFGNSHIDFSGNESHGAGEVQPNAPDVPYTAPDQPKQEPYVQSGQFPHQESQASGPFYQNPQDVPQYYEDRPAPSVSQDRPLTSDYIQPEHSDYHSQKGSESFHPVSAPRSDHSVPPSGPFYDPQYNPPVNQPSYDEQTEWNRKHQEYKDDVLDYERETREKAVRDRRDSAVQDYQARMDQSYGYQSFGHGHIDFSGKENHGAAPYQPYIYTAAGVAPAFGGTAESSVSRLTNQELYRAALENGKITSEMSRAMKDNLAEIRKEYEAAKGTPEFQAVSQRYHEARQAVFALNNDIRNNIISLDRGESSVSNSANVSRTYRAGKGDSFTAYRYTPTGIEGTSYENGKASAGVIVHNAPGTVGKAVLSPENPLLVTRAYEESLSRDAAFARAQLRSGDTEKFTPAELAAYKTSLDAYEGYRRAKNDGLVRVTSGQGAVNTPDQKAWAARQETYRGTSERQRQRDSNPGKSDSMSNQQREVRTGRSSSEAVRQPDGRNLPDRKGIAPFGSVFAINYNRGKYTAGEKESSSDLLNRDTKVRRSGIIRTTGSRLYQGISLYAPEVAARVSRKVYMMMQASNESGPQSIRTFEQGRYYGAVGTGIAMAYATRNVGSVKRFENRAARFERHNFGFTRDMSNKDVSRQLHTRMNESRAAKNDIRQMYERESALNSQERSALARKLKEHKGMGKETSKWAGLQNARLKEKVQKEVLEELHRKTPGLVTDNALKELQNQRRQIHAQRRAILKGQTERDALNKRISELQRKGKKNLTEAECNELKDLRGRMSKLTSDPRLKALDRKEQEILKQFKKKPNETAPSLKRIKLKDAQELRSKIIKDHAALENGKFVQFNGVKTSLIRKNKQLLERQSEIAKRKINNLLAKGRRTAAEEKELRQLMALLKKNQGQIKAHADILNLRNIRDLKVDAIDKVRRQLLKNKQRMRMGKMALVGFLMRPLQEGDSIGAQGLAKGITYGTNPYVHGLVRSSVKLTLRFTKFAGRTIGKYTGLDVALKPAFNKAKEIKAGARKIASTPKELQKKAIKTASDAAKRAADRMTPQFVKTGNAAIRSTLSSVSGYLKKSKLGKAYEATARAFAKVKAAMGTAAKAAISVGGKILIIFVIIFLLVGLITMIGGGIGGSVPSFLIMGNKSTDDGKVDLTPYAEVYNEELVRFEEEIIAAKTGKNYTNITEICYGPSDHNNIKEVLSMMAVRMSQDLDMEENPDVEPYIRSLFNDSHIITKTESEPYSCSGCKTRVVTVGHSADCPDDCTAVHTAVEQYCPGDHVDLTITITTLVFDEIFTADSKGNADQEVQSGALIGSDFEITFYLPTGNQTASGTTPTAGRTIAVDPNVIPLGTHVIINGHEYIAEDTGGAVTGHIIDIFVDRESDIPSEGRFYDVSVYYADFAGEGIQTSGEWNGWVEENRVWAKTIYEAPWEDLYAGMDAVGAIAGGDWIDYDWSDFEYSDESNLTEAQQRVAFIAQNSSRFGIPAKAGYCQAWVRRVYSAAGFTGGSAASAVSAGKQWLVSSDWSNIPVGATVYGYSNSVYGHVGIYVGNGQVYHNVGGVAIDSLQSWVSKYRGFGWGWQGGYDLTSVSTE